MQLQSRDRSQSPFRNRLELPSVGRPGEDSDLVIIGFEICESIAIACFSKGMALPVNALQASLRN